MSELTGAVEVTNLQTASGTHAHTKPAHFLKAAVVCDVAYYVTVGGNDFGPLAAGAVFGGIAVGSMTTLTITAVTGNIGESAVMWGV